MTARFYEILFTRYPQVRSMFGRDRSKQGEMLQAALVAVLERLEDAPWLTETLGAMGLKHLDYGVTDEMYDWVGECLLAALAEIAGDAWTPEVAGQWTEAYGVSRARAPPPVAASRRSAPRPDGSAPEARALCGESSGHRAALLCAGTRRTVRSRVEVRACLQAENVASELGPPSPRGKCGISAMAVAKVPMRGS
jgi:hemoglobin-like flavoprotein